MGISYFRKKGMSINCNIYLKKNKGVLVKAVYLPAMYRCDQDMITRLNIAVVLKEYEKDESSVSILAVIIKI